MPHQNVIKYNFIPWSLILINMIPYLQGGGVGKHVEGWTLQLLKGVIQ